MPEENEGLDVGDGFASSETASPEQIEEAYSSAFFNGPQFLQSVPEQHRAIVQQHLEPVMKSWDGGLTEKFNKHKEEVGRWSELGSYEDVQRANAFFQQLRSNGDQVLGQMIRAFQEHHGPNFPQEMNRILGIQMEQAMSDASQGNDWDYGQNGEPDPNQVFQQNVMSELEELRQFKQQYTEQQEMAQAEKAFDSLLSEVHTARADIPQDYIVQAIAAGHVNRDTIEKSWDNLKQNFGSQQAPRKNPPPVMGGQGGIPSGQVDVSKLDSKGRKALAEQWLASAQQQ